MTKRKRFRHITPTISSTLVTVHTKVAIRATMKILMLRSICGRVMDSL